MTPESARIRQILVSGFYDGEGAVEAGKLLDALDAKLEAAERERDEARGLYAGRELALKDAAEFIAEARAANPNLEKALNGLSRQVGIEAERAEAAERRLEAAVRERDETLRINEFDIQVAHAETRETLQDAERRAERLEELVRHGMPVRKGPSLAWLADAAMAMPNKSIRLDEHPPEALAAAEGAGDAVAYRELERQRDSFQARAEAAERRAERLTEALLNAKRDVFNVKRAAFDSTRAALATAALRRIDEALAAAEGAGDAA